MSLICAACRRPRELDELLRVTEIRQPWRSFLIDRPDLYDGRCFRDGVGPASVHRIAPASATPPDSRPGGGTLSDPLPSTPSARRSHDSTYLSGQYSGREDGR